jgi:hypothetical protein
MMRETAEVVMELAATTVATVIVMVSRLSARKWTLNRSCEKKTRRRCKGKIYGTR